MTKQPTTHVYDDLPVCPYCEHEHRDAFEWGDDGPMNCEECDKEFGYSRNTEITYSTWPIPEVVSVAATEGKVAE